MMISRVHDYVPAAMEKSVQWTPMSILSLRLRVFDANSSVGFSALGQVRWPLGAGEATCSAEGMRLAKLRSMRIARLSTQQPSLSTIYVVECGCAPRSGVPVALRASTSATQVADKWNGVSARATLERT